MHQRPSDSRGSMTTVDLSGLVLSKELLASSRRKKIRQDTPTNVRMHEIALCTLCVGNELFCRLAPHPIMVDFASCCNLAKFYLHNATFGTFYIILKIPTPSCLGHQCWHILCYVEDSRTFVFRTPVLAHLVSC